MIEVSNIKYRLLELKYPKDLEQWKKPLLTNDELSFKMETNSAFANAIRSCAMNEIPTKILTFDFMDVSNGDKFIIIEAILRTINLIFIDQSISESCEFQLRIINDTGKPLNIYSGDIQQTKGPKGNYFNKNIKLFTMSESNVGIDIKRITIKVGTGKHYAAHNIVSFKYRTLTPTLSSNIDHSHNIGSGGKSVLETEFKTFELGFNLNGIIRPKVFINLVIDTLENMVDNGLDHTTIGSDFTEFHFKTGYLFYGNLIHKYIYDEDNTIKYLTVNTVHPESEKVSVYVGHINAEKLYENAIKSLKKDLDKFRKYFDKI